MNIADSRLTVLLAAKVRGDLSASDYLCAVQSLWRRERREEDAHLSTEVRRAMCNRAPRPRTA